MAISGFTGNSEHHKDVVRRFAHAGFYAIAPELYFREGGMQGKDFPEMAKVSAQVTRAQYVGDIKAAAEDGWKRCIAFFTTHLKAQPDGLGAPRDAAPGRARSP